MREETIKHPQCPKCNGFSRYVNIQNVFPGERLSLERVFHCAPCKTYAHANREGVPLEGMGIKRLHNLRQRVLKKLEDSGMTQSTFQAEMDRKPWQMSILFWDRKTCVRAINTVLIGYQAEEDKSAKELLS